MDTEQQARLYFLEEAEEYLNNLESQLMDLDAQGIQPSILDSAMRAAHSLKGGAAMMRLAILSKIAHRLEDFLKILRVRKDDSLLDGEVTTLLLQGVDRLREARNLYQQKTSIDEDWFTSHSQPVFDALRHRLGDLREEDEDLLLAEEEQVDVSTLIFQSGVEDCLSSFESQIDTLEPDRLKEELAIQAEELAELGQMSSIEPFVQLCQSVQQQLAVVSLAEVKDLARQALKLWERSHALVLVGRMDKLPTSLNGSAVEATSPQPDIADFIDAAELAEAQELAFESISDAAFDLDEFTPDADEISQLDAAFGSIDDLIDPQASVDLDELTPDAEPKINEELDLDELIPDADELSELDAAFAEVEIPSSEPVAQSSPASPESSKPEPKRMVRVPAEQLERLNDLSSQLILERNAAILRLDRLKNFVDLTRERMRRLEQSSNQLRKLYDWASIEGAIVSSQPETFTANASGESSSSREFDSLEMDRYSDLHLLSQSQMETIVQLQEVTADVDLEIQEMDRVIRNFNYTTRELQQNVTRSQMRPFAELVGRFPRLIRDLSSQHDKQANLIIEGKNTYIDRQALELLGDPLTHLLRNAFDHGLEDTETRIAAGKPAAGTITLKAIQQGNQTVITISDDGGGIDTRKIRDRLLKLGFSQEQLAQIPEADLLEAIFEPGFSTADKVTELSGRGVGMDVVRSNLQQIRGDIQVETELGKGTTFTIAVPLSLLVLRVVIVETAGMVFAIPVHSIKEIVQFDAKSVIYQDEQEQINWGGQTVNLLRLHKYLRFQRPSKSFEMTGNPKIQTPTVLIFADNTRLQGIYLEKYWNEQEIAIKPVKTSIPLFPGFTGSTVLGDGRVIPLIEPIALSKGIIKRPKISTQTIHNLKNNSNFDFPVSDLSTILVVDDSVNVRRYLMGMLERNGYRVEEAKDGRDAVDKLLAGLQVQAIICDIEMPRLDGYGVLSEVKSESNLEQIPIAMLTSRSNDKHRKLAMKLGASAYFSKPFNESEMLQTLKSLI